MSSSTSTPDSVQVINERKEFNQKLSDYLDVTNTLNSGLDYHIVSVFGSQSTGKSTLLNALFGTKFQVMNEAQRSQTTKGIWMGKAIMSGEAEAISDSDDYDNGSSISTKSSDEDAAVSVSVSPSKKKSGDDYLNVVPSSSHILVLDVEGTDGRERGEDQDFERRSALFALATSEVLIVNMWESQVGLYQGANMGLLKTVFEVNLSLFQTSGQASRSLILFVIRDHRGSASLDSLASTVIEDLDKHWESIAKPTEELKSSKISDFFDIQFFALPHKVFLPEKFSEQVNVLARRFTNAHSSAYVFKPEYHRKVPIDGWAMYANQIWEQIELNKDLDLPTQQMLLARFRCEEISGQSFKYFDEELAKLNQSKGGILGGTQVVPGFGESIKAIRSEALGQFDSLASRYHENVYLSKRKDLQSLIDTRISILYHAQLQALHKASLELFHSTITKAPEDSSFEQTVLSARAAAEGHFETGAKEATIDEEVFNYDEHRNRFTAELQTAEDQKKEEAIKKIVTRVGKRVSRIFAEDIDSFFVTPDEDTWRKVSDFFNATLRTVLSPYDGGKDFKVGATSDINKRGAHDIRKAAWVSLDSKLREITREDNVVMRLREIFENSFRYDKNGVPVVWKATDDIEGPYIKARDHALSVLPIFATAQFADGEKFEPDVIIDEDADDFSLRIRDTKLQEISTKFRRQADALYVDAKRSTSQSTAHIPFYIIVLLVVLGWNEFMAVLRNPFLILFAMMAGGGAYLAYCLDMWGPIITVTSVMIEKSSEIAKEKLRQALDVPVAPAHQSAVPGGSAIPLDDLTSSGERISVTPEKTEKDEEL
ncbi:dynamin-like GTPase SEY1 [Sugiyamaella lignohabitans]|uniref:Dynamin-like GTPase SEY1 n=1 Tax=Sugiyamaella lignohabitans TaxID=796027 RepID=A0A161HFN0_9ASCO|nr:dynamin-like GTPase SEY1 [Sugiyamaella lignohabitans]ANB11381.1 dynamin-like GTPase SEY1 [Sugiyamaella lignohabitans]